MIETLLIYDLNNSKSIVVNSKKENIFNQHILYIAVEIVKHKIINKCFSSGLLFTNDDHKVYGHIDSANVLFLLLSKDKVEVEIIKQMFEELRKEYGRLLSNPFFEVISPSQYNFRSILVDAYNANNKK